MELFIANDPRWLSGGGAKCGNFNYGGDAPFLEPGETRVTSELLRRNYDPARDGLATALAQTGQRVHRGKSSYHCRPELNVFLENDGWPSVGIELETIRRDRPSTTGERLRAQLVSNWFHFEEDGSLRSTGDGYECITEPLPSRVYRDVRTWIGLQNTLAPYVYSWVTSATGLHVHVGLSAASRIAASDAGSVPKFVRVHTGMEWSGAVRRLLRFTMFFIQTNIADEALLSEVFLRSRGGYCGRCPSPFGPTRQSWATARDAVSDILLSALEYNELTMRMNRLADRINDGDDVAFADPWFRALVPRPPSASGHNAEMNADHYATFEFRRGKGTLNGSSIHRMVEYCVLVERFAEKILTEPDMVPSNRNFRLFLADNTMSAALRETALKTITNAKG